MFVVITLSASYDGYGTSARYRGLSSSLLKLINYQSNLSSSAALNDFCRCFPYQITYHDSATVQIRNFQYSEYFKGRPM